MRQVFVLGDSISIHYGPYLQKELAEHCTYDRKRGTEDALKDLNLPVGANGGDSGMVLAYLEEQKEHHVSYDILLLNCGLHDMKTDPVQQTKQIDIDTYAANLQSICEIAAELSRQIIWVRTTPVIEEIHNKLNPSFYRYTDDVVKYNAVADRVMNQNKVPMIDLYTFTLELGSDVFCDHVHFKDEVREKQAEFIAEKFKSIIL